MFDDVSINNLFSSSLDAVGLLSVSSNTIWGGDDNVTHALSLLLPLISNL